MAFEFLSNLDTTTFFLLMIIFILFAVSMKKVFSILVNAAWITVAAILFPVVMNRFFGFDIPIDRDSIISFVLLGLAVYFVYLVGKSIYKVLGVAERAAKKVPFPHGEKKVKVKEEREEKPDKSQKEAGKGLKEREKELQKKEQQIRFASAIQKKRKSGSWEKNYVELEYSKEKPAKPKSSHITPLPVIEHKKKKKHEEE